MQGNGIYLLRSAIARVAGRKGTSYNHPIRRDYDYLNKTLRIRIGRDPHVYDTSLDCTTDLDMRKSNLIRLVDSLLFGNLQRKILEIYSRARSMNNQADFSHYFFSGEVGSTTTLPPSEEVIAFLSPYVTEYTPAIDNRRAINYLVIRFLNEASEPLTLLHLLPISILPADIREHMENIVMSAGDEKLLAQFVESPEYKLLKRQVVFNTME